jgi:hypothetical protein
LVSRRRLPWRAGPGDRLRLDTGERGVVKKIGRKYLHFKLDGGGMRQIEIEDAGGFNPHISGVANYWLAKMFQD